MTQPTAMSQPNPYASPEASPIRSRRGEVDSAALHELERTKPWVRLCSVGSILLGLASLVMGIYSFSSSALSGSVLALAGLAYLIPGIYLWSYGSAIGALSRSSQPADLQAALAVQRRFWCLIGWFLILGIVAYTVLTAVLVLKMRSVGP